MRTPPTHPNSNLEEEKLHFHEEEKTYVLDPNPLTVQYDVQKKFLTTSLTAQKKLWCADNLLDGKMYDVRVSHRVSSGHCPGPPTSLNLFPQCFGGHSMSVFPSIFRETNWWSSISYST